MAVEQANAELGLLREVLKKRDTNMAKRPLKITVSGPVAAGKTTLLRKLEAWLESDGHSVEFADSGTAQAVAMGSLWGEEEPYAVTLVEEPGAACALCSDSPGRMRVVVPYTTDTVMLVDCVCTHTRVAVSEIG
jgi:signal recognition particle GTPase